MHQTTLDHGLIAWSSHNIEAGRESLKQSCQQYLFCVMYISSNHYLFDQKIKVWYRHIIIVIIILKLILSVSDIGNNSMKSVLGKIFIHTKSNCFLEKLNVAATKLKLASQVYT